MLQSLLVVGHVVARFGGQGLETFALYPLILLALFSLSLRKRLELVFRCDGLSEGLPAHLAAVASCTETEIQILALKAEPVSHPAVGLLLGCHWDCLGLARLVLVRATVLLVSLHRVHFWFLGGNRLGMQIDDVHVFAELFD